MEIIIGDKFLRTKRKDICTVIDIYKTYNIKNELVRTEYKYEFNFINQKISGFCPQATIVLNKIEE